MDTKEGKLIKEWLDEFTVDNTKKVYANHIKVFMKWYLGTLTEFLSLTPKERSNIAIQFQKDLVKKPLAHTDTNPQPFRTNAAISIVTALCSFTRKHAAPIDMRRKWLAPEMDESSHAFSTKDLTQMFDVGDLQEKAIVALFASLGWEASAVIGLDKIRVQQMIARTRKEGDNFIFFPNQRQKTHVRRLGIINPLAIESLQAWFETPEAIALETIFLYTSVDGVNKSIQRLARKANIAVVGRVHSHLFRKWVSNQLMAARFNDAMWKLVIGKKIPSQDETYLTSLTREIEKTYPQIYEEFMNIKPTHIANGKVKAEVEDLKDRLKGLASMVYLLAKDRPEVRTEALKHLDVLEKRRLEKIEREQDEV